MKSGPDSAPPPHASIDELHAWAARTNPAANAGRAAAELSTTAHSQDAEPRTSAFPSKWVIRAVLVLAAGIAAYAVFSFLIGLLMIVGTVAAVGVLLFLAFKAGRISGRRSR